LTLTCCGELPCDPPEAARWHSHQNRMFGAALQEDLFVRFDLIGR